ncbi:Telomerase protein component 1 [Marasmius tenuissimus]|uniref:phosphatidylinositol-3,4,5-trisphosphate 3-phosphatase n=1 Tax=Marasmius tenuissimus TaxID=585030 RepID=A0ABR3A7E3_9AGAR
MTDYVRRLVSGQKARFKDKNLDVELDLVYLTDQVIIMGYPASGMEGLYRNRREDVKKFLEHRHGKNYWIFNFCPIKENSYDAQFFDGRVSRFPFPDHHAPPLAIMPLVAREMRIWLDGSPERVAVLHCKAGKGRSGTMACTYLLSLDISTTMPKLERSDNTAKDWAVTRAKEAMAVVPPDEETEETAPASGTEEVSDTLVESPVQEPVGDGSHHKHLNKVLDLHTSRRMRQPSSPDKKVKQGVSIPSQRRWLYYWSLLLSKQAPSHLWSMEPLVPSSSLTTLSTAPPEERRNSPKVRLTEIKLRMKESSGMTMNLVRAANAFLDRGKGGGGQVWVSLARYDDSFVQLIERWERYTRDEEGHLGRRKPGTGHFGEEALTEIFKGHKWDGEKMVRSFARLGCPDDKAVSKVENENHEKIITYNLSPLSDNRWKNLQEEIEKAKAGETVVNPEEFNIPASEANSMYDLTETVKDKGVVLDAAREVRVKLYMGQIFMGWLWFVPTFHMPQPPPTNGHPSEPTTIKLTRKELDFPLGVGSSIVDVEITLEWVTRADNDRVQPPAVATPAEEKEEGRSEPMGLTAAAQAVTTGQGISAVEAKQAGED